MTYKEKPFLEAKAYNVLGVSLLLVLFTGIYMTGQKHGLTIGKLPFLLTDSILIVFAARAFINRKSLIDLIMITLSYAVIAFTVYVHVVT